MIADDLTNLYQDLIIDHNKRPRNFRELPPPRKSSDGYNPLCGDHLTVYLQINDEGQITDLTFKGDGCAISVASASLMTEALKGKSIEQARALFTAVHNMLTESKTNSQDIEMLGKLAALQGVRDYPSRVKCATLAWHTMQAALAGESNEVTTE